MKTRSACANDPWQCAKALTFAAPRAPRRRESSAFHKSVSSHAGEITWSTVRTFSKALELASHLAAYPLDRYTVFEKQYNTGVELMKSIDLMYQTMLAELGQRSLDAAWTAD